MRKCFQQINPSLSSILDAEKEKEMYINNRTSSAEVFFCVKLVWDFGRVSIEVIEPSVLVKNGRSVLNYNVERKDKKKKKTIRNIV